MQKNVYCVYYLGQYTLVHTQYTRKIMWRKFILDKISVQKACFCVYCVYYPIANIYYKKFEKNFARGMISIYFRFLLQKKRQRIFYFFSYQNITFCVYQVCTRCVLGVYQVCTSITRKTQYTQKALQRITRITLVFLLV